MKRTMRIALASILMSLWLVTCYASDLTPGEKLRFSQGHEAFKSGEYEKALEYWVPLAQRGNVHVQMSVTAAYNAKGDLESRKQALNWYEKAALQGHPEAQDHLAAAHAKGELVERDIYI